jgi:hypothetical protein
LVENSSVDNKKEGAIGPYQIREIFVKDVNRISGENFTHEDARNPRKAKQMTFIYLTYYGKKHEERTGKRLTARSLGRLFNGGPMGNYKKCSEDYGNRCQNIYDMTQRRK